MAYRVVPMTVALAERIARWHYPPPYDCYDVAADADDQRQFLDPANWPDVYFGVLDEARIDDPLVGFFSFERLPSRTVEVGLGLRPDLTGRGRGRAFLEAGLAFARERYAPSVFELSVATFNERAIRVYETCGFERVETADHATNGGVSEVQRMRRPA